ncbi:small subunit ribosomal protein S16 [Streptomyces sp. B4I13]|uniref:Small ribosomal subunit protein bS16 n=1 Tax=Streptomyces achromogenes TaxID=67255 RepID=A0ABU0Q782_STRAH|nr:MULTISPECIES: 30S ribosomal protein S16 [Streptomyces]MDQ0686526.1 small subunit ribosomal protein S16 [Streptomyces achromogenes]MDQ0833654.1 small subunit ribosomal protein S16 [Streptomyces achromogenes]MDQ0958903.1 small subunit ribosomal protein S16 [Streptomyces sp. B4I13]
MAVKIKLKRLGKIRSPHYRIVVADSRTRRDGRAIEEIGKYQPTYHPSVMEVDADRVAYWLGVGAQPTEPVLAILKKTGDWQKFKGEPAPAPLLVAEPKKARPTFEALGGEDSGKGEAITQKKKAEKKDEAAAESSESTEA